MSYYSASSKKSLFPFTHAHYSILFFVKPLEESSLEAVCFLRFSPQDFPVWSVSTRPPKCHQSSLPLNQRVRIYPSGPSTAFDSISSRCMEAFFSLGYHQLLLFLLRLWPLLNLYSWIILSQTTIKCWNRSRLDPFYFFSTVSP